AVFLILVIIHSKAIKAGDWVLTQGTGGAGLAAIQFAAAAVATVVSTMSSNEKAETLKELGLGFDHILDIGSTAGIAQLLKAIKLKGLITIIGFLTSADSDKQPPLMDALNYICIVRGVFVGSKQ
ncbi:hypothetical protein H9L39_19085, partial [Fusarium oxysporum f. sp. albedinis]